MLSQKRRKHWDTKHVRPNQNHEDVQCKYLLTRAPLLDTLLNLTIQLTTKTVVLLKLKNWNLISFWMKCVYMVVCCIVSRFLCSLRNYTCRVIISSNTTLQSPETPRVRNSEGYRKRERLTQNYTVWLPL